jgi:hypothetical protein
MIDQAVLRGRLERWERALTIADAANDREFAEQLRVNVRQLRAKLDAVGEP